MAVYYIKQDSSSLREGLYSLARLFAIEDADGNPVFFVRKRLISIGNQLTMTRTDGQKVAFIGQKSNGLWSALIGFLGAIWLIVFYARSNAIWGMRNLGNWNYLIGIGAIVVAIIIAAIPAPAYNISIDGQNAIKMWQKMRPDLMFELQGPNWTVQGNLAEAGYNITTSSGDVQGLVTIVGDGSDGTYMVKTADNTHDIEILAVASTISMMLLMPQH